MEGGILPLEIINKGKKCMVDVLCARGILTTVKDDTVICSSNASMDFSVKDLGNQKYRGEIVLTSSSHQSPIRALWTKDDPEPAVCKIVDALLGTRLFYELATKRIPSLQEDIDECKTRVCNLFAAHGFTREADGIDVELSFWGTFEGRIRLSGHEAKTFRWELGTNEFEWAARDAVGTILGLPLVEEYKAELYGRVPKEQADKAAKWWADQIRGKEIKPPEKLEKTAKGLMAILSRELHSGIHPLRVDRFQAILSQKLQTEIMSPLGIGLTVDYDPCKILWECWRHSDPSDDDDGFCVFPCKTRMTLHKTKISVGSLLQSDKYDQYI